MQNSEFHSENLSTSWLNAFAYNDIDDRMPRSILYVKQGKVKDVSISKGIVRARVEGSGYESYKVIIEFKPWSKSRRQLLNQLMAENNQFIQRLKEGYIDLNIIEAMDGFETGLFSNAANVLSTDCTCQDDANPCKHVMALAIVLSERIENNNLMILDLYGMDSSVELKNNNIAKKEKYALPLLSDLIAKPIEAKSDVDSFEHILTDTQSIPYLLDTLASFLPKEPKFYPGKDFAEIYSTSLRQLSFFAKKREVDESSDQVHFNKDYNPELKLNKFNSISYEKHRFGHTFIGLLESIATMPPKRLFQCSPEIQGLYYAYKVALGLLQQGAVVPELYTLPDTTSKDVVALRWLPAMTNTQVDKVLQELALLLPDMLSFEGELLSGLQQAVALCSSIIETLIIRCGVTFDIHPITQLFFKRFFNENDLNEIQIKRIHQWILSLELWQDQFTPMFVLEIPKSKHDNHFILGSVSVIDSENKADGPTSLASILRYNKYQKQRSAITPTINKMLAIYPPFQEYLNDSARNPMVIEIHSIPELFAEVLPALRALGISISLPIELQKVFHPELSIKINSRPTNEIISQGFFKLHDVLKFNWEVMIGDKSISAKEFEALIKNNQKMVRYNNQFIVLDAKKIAEIRLALAIPPKLNQMDLLKAALSNEYENAAITLDASAKKLLKQFQQEKEITLPKKLNAELRPYQLRGFNWLYRNIRLGVGSIIADDMGLGKTLQVITAILKLKQDGSLKDQKALVVVPASLLINWQKEIMRFAPSLTFTVFHGYKRELNMDVDIIITTYGMVRSELELLKEIEWSIIVIDEAQNIKNPVTAQTQSMKELTAKHYIAMSGTPVENHLSEYWSIMDFANPGLLGSLTYFNKEYSNPIQNKRDEKVLERFKKITSPFLLRRLKSDKTIIQDLPDKIEQDQFCALSTQQLALYVAAVRDCFAEIEEKKETFERNSLILQMILSLKKICNHPAHYLKDDNDDIKLSGKAERFLELMEEIHENQQKVIIFTQYREMGEILQRWINQYFELKCDFLHGGVDHKKRNVMVENFQNNPEQWAFVLSLKAGGTGLNLTAATNVIHYDLWWNAAVETQASDRVYRIGQKKNVQIHRLITKGTFEEKINNIIQLKKELSDITVGAGEKWIGNLSNTELKEIFEL